LFLIQTKKKRQKQNTLLEKYQNTLHSVGFKNLYQSLLLVIALVITILNSISGTNKAEKKKQREVTRPHAAPVRFSQFSP